MTLIIILALLATAVFIMVANDIKDISDNDKWR